MKTNQFFLFCCLILMICQHTRGQDFKLYFANNISDVVNFGQIETDMSGLSWSEVRNGEIAGNQVEVDAVMRMFASQEKKGLAQQRQFWTMRGTVTAEPKVDESGNPVYELDEHGEPVLEFVYDENGNHLYEEDGVTYKTQLVQAYTITESYEEKGYTVCLPFASTLTLEENSEAKVYAPTEITDIEGVTTVIFSEVEGEQMEANTPYYIVVSSGGATVTGQGGSVTQHQTAGTTVIDGASYQFMGTTATIPNATLYDAQKPAYILQSDGIWYKVPENQSRAYVGPFRAYFQATMPNGARSLAMMFSGSYNPGEGSDPNAIGPVVRTIDADGTQRVFDLSGRPLPSSNRIEPWRRKGIVIMNGKKYFNIQE